MCFACVLYCRSALLTHDETQAVVIITNIYRQSLGWKWPLNKIKGLSVTIIFYLTPMAELPWAWVCEDGQRAVCCFIGSLFNNGEDGNLCHLWANVSMGVATELVLFPISNSSLRPFFFLTHKKRGKVEEVQRKVGVVLLNGQKLELSCDIKAVCKDVLDMVVAHIGLVEHHLFGLAYLRGTVCCTCGLRCFCVPVYVSGTQVISLVCLQMWVCT